jgi:hypothetical protein
MGNQTLFFFFPVVLEMKTRASPMLQQALYHRATHQAPGNTFELFNIGPYFFLTNIIFFIHICIQCLGHFSAPPSSFLI